jgi:hypothetical protein
MAVALPRAVVVFFFAAAGWGLDPGADFFFAAPVGRFAVAVGRFAAPVGRFAVAVFVAFDFAIGPDFAPADLRLAAAGFAFALPEDFFFDDADFAAVRALVFATLSLP